MLNVPVKDRKADRQRQREREKETDRQTDRDRERERVKDQLFTDVAKTKFELNDLKFLYDFIE